MMCPRRSRHFWFFVLFVCAFLVAGKTTHACSCGARPTVLDSYDHSDEVVVVRVISVEKVAEDAQGLRHYVDGVRTTTAVVEKVFKGYAKVRDELIFAQRSGADCIWTFNEKSVGEEFLFYLNGPGKTSPYIQVEDPKLWLVDAFAKLWARRATVIAADGTAYELMALADLVKAKKTQRDKDWPMIRRLVEADYFRHRERPRRRFANSSNHPS